MARSPMLRSWVEIFGCAWVILTGSPEQQRLVREGNALTWFTALYILCVLEAGWYFALENPLISLMWWFPLLKMIMAKKGVTCTHFNMTDYGAMWKKATCVMHNAPVMHLLKLDMGIKPTVALRGQIWYEGAMIFLTPLACAYPPLLGTYAAELSPNCG